jgi:hypothetical protein
MKSSDSEPDRSDCLREQLATANLDRHEAANIAAWFARTLAIPTVAA